MEDVRELAKRECRRAKTRRAYVSGSRTSKEAGWARAKRTRKKVEGNKGERGEGDRLWRTL